MACTSLSGGITKGCDNNQGGIKTIYFTELENVTAFTHGSPAENITGITMDGATKFYEFEFNKNTSTYTEVTTHTLETGTKVVTQTATLVLNYREQTKRDTLLLLGNFKELACIVKDANNKFWVLGETNGLTLTENNSETGTVKTDRNGYTLTFVGEEPEEACETSQSVVTSVI